MSILGRLCRHAGRHITLCVHRSQSHRRGMCVKHVTLHRKYIPPGVETKLAINSPAVCCLLPLFFFFLRGLCLSLLYLQLGNASLFPWDKCTPGSTLIPKPEHQLLQFAGCVNDRWRWKKTPLKLHNLVPLCLVKQADLLERICWEPCFLFITEALRSDPAPPAVRICLPGFLSSYHSNVWWIGLSVPW